MTTLKLQRGPLIEALDAMARGDHMSAYGLLQDAIRMSNTDQRRAACTKAFVETARALGLSHIHEVI